MIFNTTQTTEIISNLKAKKLGILPTDTIYGIHCLALNPELEEKVYKIKQRSEQTPFITIISDPNDLIKFDIVTNDFEKEQIKKLWPGPNTLIFKTSSGTTKSFRLPANAFLITVLKKTGPLISTSANIHNQPFAKSIDEAISYFGDEIDFYVDAGVLDNPPSSIYKFENNSFTKIR